MGVMKIYSGYRAAPDRGRDSDSDDDDWKRRDGKDRRDPRRGQAGAGSRPWQGCPPRCRVVFFPL